MHTVTIGMEFANPLREYLDAPVERMAFLLSTADTGGWTACEVLYLSDETDYAYQTNEGMELADHVRPKVLQSATQSSAGLIEIHSHGPTAWPAAFSRTDLIGLREVAPQMLWRLPERPYIAIVLHDQDADALVWTHRQAPPFAPESIIFGQQKMHPTGRSAGRLAREAG